ncbi:putative membrane protein insertion efficiency factor [Rhizomicrobium palustre]|uniref:Putative membrane protein insertion efficiency factor n=1 Tax=Rhizomicrobium palustre TaxID=189966 RepID=A0A846MXR7_9PROT|nr:membrane protein insertion efficiency factor YidD [Rhizomicrobium palustre]NIK87852.1 putative membrane protein insertion efficiency factor [Rhizomicrobium palustre]
MLKSALEAVRRIAVALLIAPIRFYRYFISPMFPPACRFTPTCSQYAIEALRVHGPLKGLYLTARRLSRCHPIRWLGGSHGFDPVPPRSTE